MYMTRQEKCKFAFPDLKKENNEIKCVFKCSKDEYSIKTIDDCKACEKFKSKYIEYPITVKEIENKPIEKPEKCLCKDRIGKFVKVRPAGQEKTFLGIFLGSLPYYNSISYNEQTEQLSITPIENPAMFIPELNQVVFGYESWWTVIENIEDFKEITTEDIENQWYVKLAKGMLEDDK